MALVSSVPIEGVPMGLWLDCLPDYHSLDQIFQVQIVLYPSSLLALVASCPCTCPDQDYHKMCCPDPLYDSLYRYWLVSVPLTSWPIFPYLLLLALSASW